MTAADPSPTLPRMTEAVPTARELQEIGRKVDQLTALALRLLDENRSLRASQESLITERAGLIARNEQTRSRVEAMINRLKSLEQNG